MDGFGAGIGYAFNVLNSAEGKQEVARDFLATNSRHDLIRRRKNRAQIPFSNEQFPLDLSWQPTGQFHRAVLEKAGEKPYRQRSQLTSLNRTS
jgi:hypothetical protein